MAAVDPARARRRIVAVALVVVGLLAVGGIVGVAVADRADRTRASGDPLTAVRAAPATVKGKRLTARSTISTGGALQLQVAQAGVFDSRAKRADVVLTGLGSSNVRLVVDDATLYARAAKPLGGKTWGRLSLGDAGPIGTGAGQVSPAQIDSYVGLLSSATAAVDKGLVTVDGKQLRRYTATVSRAAAAQASPLFARAPATQDPTLEVDLDGAGIPRLVSVASEATGTKVEIVVRVIDVGVAAAIELPPETDVASIRIDELTAALQG